MRSLALLFMSIASFVLCACDPHTDDEMEELMALIKDRKGNLKIILCQSLIASVVFEQTTRWNPSCAKDRIREKNKSAK